MVMALVLSLTMMGMVLRVVGMVMALLFLGLTMMGMILTIAMALTTAMLLTIAMVPTIAMVLMTVIVHLTAAKAMVHLIVTTGIVQSEVMFHDLPMVDSVPKCVTCMPGRTVSVWVIMTRCSPGMVGETVM